MTRASTEVVFWLLAENGIFDAIHEIPLNFVQLRNAEFREIALNFRQYCTEYGRDGSTKTYGIPCRQNTVDTLIMSCV